MISRGEGLVLEITGQREGLTELIVEAAGNNCPAVNYDALTGTVNVGDRVLLNTTAVELNLGTGGSHFVMANLTSPTAAIASGAVQAGAAEVEAAEPEDAKPSDPKEVYRQKSKSHHGHIMKIRYTPNQLKVLAVEEEDSPFHKKMAGSFSLDGVPVVCCSLHSMLPPAAAAVKAFNPELKVAYLMTDGAALPLKFSRLVHSLKNKGMIDGTITVGHAFGGDLEAVNIYSGLLAAVSIMEADVVIAAMGPGIIGTGTPFGFTGIEQAQLLHAVHSLEGFPIAVPRLGFADSRERHQGLSHHSRITLGKAVLVPVHVGFPVMKPETRKTILEQMQESGITSKHSLVEEDGAQGLGLLEEHKIRVTTMGRSVAEEPEYFLAASCSGRIAAKVCAGEKLRLWEE